MIPRGLGREFVWEVAICASFICTSNEGGCQIFRARDLPKGNSVLRRGERKEQGRISEAQNANSNACAGETAQKDSASRPLYTQGFRPGLVSAAPMALLLLTVLRFSVKQRSEKKAPCSMKRSGKASRNRAGEI